VISINSRSVKNLILLEQMLTYFFLTSAKYNLNAICKGLNGLSWRKTHYFFISSSV